MLRPPRPGNATVDRESGDDYRWMRITLDARRRERGRARRYPSPKTGYTTWA
jgi:hypothetical protein